jgi:[protein-PII] uridylyltransferase
MGITGAGSAAVLEQARQSIGQDILSGATAMAALERYTAYVDRELRQLCASAQLTTPFALVAIGGYGRRHLCPFSDIDLLIVFGGSVGDAEERFLRALLHPLWDAGFVVGQQVREIAELAEPEVDNPEFLIALADARLVTGDSSLFARLEETLQVPPARAAAFEAMTKLVDTRYGQFNATLYQLEPDVKEAPGGLRDVSAARTIAKVTDPAMLRRGKEDEVRLGEAEEFLLRIRALLHIERRRNDNVLSHELQEKVARQLEYPGASPRREVEALMTDYFRHARVVSRMLERIRRSAPAPVGVNLGRTPEGVRFIDPRKATIEPSTWLAVFASAIEGNTGVADETLDLIRRHAEQYSPADFFPTDDDRAALLRFLRPRPGLYARLSEMHDCGLLGRMIPPFAAITHRVVRDFYHRYTVDEHTLLTIRNLERLPSAENARARFATLLRDLDAPELLVLALLLHDVGKWHEEDHATESVRMAEGLLAQLDLGDHARDTVLFLIHHHLRMSQVAFRRDTEDPDIVRTFASEVGTEERLKLLCLMTLADVEAVSPETLTRWKEELLWRLYVDTYNYLTLQYGDDVIERTETAAAECVARRPPDLDSAEVTTFLEGLPRRYLQLFDRKTVYEHVRLARNIHPDEVHLRLEPTEAAWELTVVTLDKPMLFSNICGVLSSFGMDILRGHAMTNPNGLVLDVFQFVDAERFLGLNPGAKDTILHALEDVVAGRSTAEDRLRGRRHGLTRRRALSVQPIVHADGGASRKYTVLEIVAPDQLGLLYRISRAIAAEHCAIDLVLIATEGEKAIDVFHITKDGAKLAPEAERALVQTLQHMLEETE